MKKPSKEEIERWISLYNIGISTHTIFRCDPKRTNYPMIRTRLIQAGVFREKVRITEKQLKEWLSLYKSGVSLKKLLKEINDYFDISLTEIDLEWLITGFSKKKERGGNRLKQ